jgi:rhamnogalacturonyl hydrolase YesR
MNLLIKYFVFFFSFLTYFNAFTQNKPYSERFAETIKTQYPDSIVVKKFLQHMLQDKQGTDPNKRPASWNYEEAVILRGIEKVWKQTGNKEYFSYIKKIIDHFINPDGTIRTYEMNEYNSDQVTAGLQLLLLYRETKEEKYKKAADLLRHQITWQPRTKEGGFWHKHKYPYQMWLDCNYMLNLFYAEYCRDFKTPQYFDDIANQFIWVESHTRDEKTGLLFHGWDESKNQKWANPQTGQSPSFWSRSIGWYAMSLVDILEIFSEKHPKKAQLTALLKKLAPVLEQYQDKSEGVWFQVTDKGGWKGNYLEASGSCMFTYMLAKGVRLGYLDKKYLAVAQKGYEGILKNFVETDSEGMVHLNNTCSGGGLGGVPYRSGEYGYYVTEPQRRDDLKGIGAFINASIEMEMLSKK